MMTLKCCKLERFIVKDTGVRNFSFVVYSSNEIGQKLIVEITRQKKS